MPDLRKKISKLTSRNECTLKQRSVVSIISVLGKLSVRWLKKNYSFRKKAVKRLVEKSYFTEAMSNGLLDSLFRELTQTKLLKLLKAELGDPRILDEFRYDKLTRKWQRARGPRVIMHIFSGNVPNPSIVSFVLGMLVKSVNIGKVSSRDEGFLDIYLESLKGLDKKLAGTNLLLDPRDKKSVHSAIQASDLVLAYGNDQSLKEIRDKVRPGTPFIGYGHRVSFGVYAKEALNRTYLGILTKRTAHDIWMTDQRGCLSPMEIWVQKKGSVTPAAFSSVLAHALQRRFDQIAWQMPDGASKWHIGFGGRKIVSVRTFDHLTDLLEMLRRHQPYLQAVSLETGKSHYKKMQMADELSRLGVNRVCRAGHMQIPPITWHHDGKWNLASWVSWTDLEV